MPRLLSVSLTEQAVIERRKTVTRRLGWWTDRNGRRLIHPGDRLTLCRKVQGRRRKDGSAEPLVRLAEVEVVSVRRERLAAITPDDVRREGFPDWTTVDFRVFFAQAMHVPSNAEVTRIEWSYLDEPEDVAVQVQPQLDKAAAGAHATTESRG